MITGLEHIAFAVEKLDDAIPLWLLITGGAMSHREIVAEQQVEVAVITIGDLHIELLCPLSPDSPTAKFLRNRGAGIHHVALRAESAGDEMARLKAAGLQFIDERVRDGANQTHICFLHPRSAGGVLVEFVESSSRVAFP